jgi:hypothetical protein
VTALRWQCPTCLRWVYTGGDPWEASCERCALRAALEALPQCGRCDERVALEDLRGGDLCRWCVADLCGQGEAAE